MLSGIRWGLELEMSSGPNNLAVRKINDYPRAKATFHEMYWRAKSFFLQADIHLTK